MSGIERIESFERDGLIFDVVDTGPLDGELVILLHGWPETARSWEKVAAILNEKGYRTLAPNQRGYSPRARPNSVRAYRIDELVADIVALIKRAGGGPVHLAGHDWGAMVAWTLAAAHPELVKTLNTLSVPHPGAFMRATLKGDQLKKSYYIGLFQIPRLPEWILMRSPHSVFGTMLRGAGMMSDEIDAAIRDLVDSGALPTTLNWYRAMRYPSKLVRVAKIKRPTLYIWGERDIALSRAGAELAGDYVDAPYRLFVMKGASHWLPTQYPEDVAEAMLENFKQAE